MATKAKTAKTTPTKARKSAATPRTTRSKSAAKPPVPSIEPVVVRETRAGTLAPPMRKKELVQAVVARSGAKPGQARAVTEAVLAELGAAIAEGRELKLPGLGKLKVQRTKKLANGEVYVTRIRQPRAKPDMPDAPDTGSGKDPLAEAAE